MTSGRVTIDNVGYKLLSGNRLHLLNTIGDVQLKDKDGDIVPVDEEFYVTLQDGEAYFIVEKSKRLSVDSTERKKVLKKSNGSAKNLIRSQSSGDLAKKVKSKSDELFNKETQEKLKDNSDIKEKKKIQLSLSLIDTNLNSSSTSLELSTTSSPSLSPMEPPETKKPKKTKPKSEKKSKDDQINSVRITPLSKSGRSFFGSESNIFKSVESERKIGRHEKSYSSDATYLKKGKKKKKVNYSAEKMAQAAITIQSAYRSYLVRKKMFSTSEKIKLVLLELYDKEKSYIEKLDVLLNNYHLPLLERVKSSEVIFDIEQITLMFRDIQIIRDIHSQIFLRLQKKVKSWRPLIRIDDVFVDMLQLLQGSYESYSTQYSDIITLIRLGTENQRIANFFALCKSTSKLRLNIQDLLIMPIQQFPHYLTLIERLVKNTPTSHPGHYHLKVLLKEITKIAGHLDSKIKEANNRHKVYGFQDSILNGPILAKGTRTFVREQSFPILIKNERTMRHFVLFNDALLCLKLTKKKDQPYEFDWMYDLLELTVEEIRADVKGSNYESPKIISKKMKDLEAKFLPDSSPTSPNLQDFRRSLKHRMNSPVQEFESLETLYQLNKGKSGFQITCTQNSKIESQTIIAEDELTRTSWVDEIQKCISLCGPNNSSIQQSSGKILTWHIKKKESKKGVEMEHMFFTIEQVSLNRLPSKNDPKVIRVLWASEAIYINALDIRSPMYLVLSEHALICAILPYATSEVQEYLLKWTIPLQKLNFEIIPELVTQGNENINLETLKLKISETQKKLEVEQRILGATQKMSSGNNSKLHSMSMKTASSKSAEKISNIKRELKNLQRQHTTSDAHYGLTLSGDSDEIHKFVFHSLETRQVFISTLEQLKQESLQRLITIKKSAGTERKRSNSLVSDVSTTEQIIVHKSFPTESNLMERPMSVSQDSPDLFYSFRSSSPTESFMTYNSADMYRSSTIRSNYTMNSNYTMSSTDSFELTPSPMSDYSDNYNEKKELYIAKENHKPKSEDDLVLVAGEEIDILKKSSKARWCGKKQDLVGLVNPKRLLELTKYGIFSPPKLDQIEKYVSISSRISDKEDFLSFGPGDEIHVIIKDLQLSSSELDETNSQQKPKDKTVLWFAKCGNKVGICTPDGLIKL